MADDHAFGHPEGAYFGACRNHESDGVQLPDDIDLDVRSTPLGNLRFCVPVDMALANP
jgi:hypothetical protein